MVGIGGKVVPVTDHHRSFIHPFSDTGLRVDQMIGPVRLQTVRQWFSDPRGRVPDSIFRIRTPMGPSVGSNVAVVSWPFSARRLHSRRIWVLLPEPCNPFNDNESAFFFLGHASILKVAGFPRCTRRPGDGTIPYTNKPGPPCKSRLMAGLSSLFQDGSGMTAVAFCGAGFHRHNFVHCLYSRHSPFPGLWLGLQDPCGS